MRKTAFWKTAWFVAVALTLLVFLASIGGLFQSLESRAYDIGFQISSRLPSQQITIVAIDEKSIAQLGTEAWSPKVLARLTDILAAAPAKLIANGVVAASALPDDGYGYLRQLSNLLAQSHPGSDPASPVIDQVVRLLAEADLQLNGEQRLAVSYAKAGRVLLPMWPATTDAGDARPNLPSSTLLRPHQLTGRGGEGIIQVGRMQLPAEPISRQAAGFGYLAAASTTARVWHREPLLVRSQTEIYLSFSLLVAARSLDLDIADIEPISGRELRLGALHVPVTAAMEINPFQYPSSNKRAAFRIVSLIDVLSGAAPSTDFAGKLVLVGMATPLPGLTQDLSILHVANSVSSILQGDWIVVPAWGSWVGLAVLLIVGIYLGAVLPRLSLLGAWLSSIGLMLGLVALQFGLMLGVGYWFPFTASIVLLLVGVGLCLLHRTRFDHMGETGGTVDERHAETAAQGPRADNVAWAGGASWSDPVLLDGLYRLARDYEDQNLFSPAEVVYRQIASLQAAYRDVDQRLLVVGKHCGEPPLRREMTPLTLLGRYRLERVLGQGAMGTVYLGRDPTINRVVALKTMDFAQEFEADELAEVRQRFFREAETAGRLNHPNIVTIYDAGEENGLAYIAMEFLAGHDLVEASKAGHLLPLPEVLSIVAQVADALDYAHQNRVVHRDIKPANIMYLPATRLVKVTDFGIARISDTSRTRAGTVLGTPSYMSPEQLAGKKVDGRSDLYSLTVTLYQMVCGQLPFAGESLAQLMYRITHESPLDIRSISPELPSCVLQLIEKGLSKNAAARFQQGAEMAAAVRACLDQLTTGIAP